MRLTLFLLLFLALNAAAQPVRQIGVFVLPYYAAAQKPGDAPTVNTYKKFNKELASNDPDVIRYVESQILKEPDWVTPITLMVLAVRLYDVGHRDDAVFWFYVAKDRFFSLSGVVQTNTILNDTSIATMNFANLAGYAFNGYAFCDVAKQIRTRQKAFRWVEKNPYKAIFWDQLPALPGDRSENLKITLKKMESNMNEEISQFSDEKYVKKMMDIRQKNGVNEKYCW